MKFFIVISCMCAAALAAVIPKPLYYGQQLPVFVPKKQLSLSDNSGLFTNGNKPIGLSLVDDKQKRSIPVVKEDPSKINAKSVLVPKTRPLVRNRRQTQSASKQNKRQATVLARNGVPLDTPEVQLARAQHMIAHYHAKSPQNGIENNVQAIEPIALRGHPFNNPKVHIPHILPNGVPVDTPEVQIERAKHIAAHAKEKARHAKKLLPFIPETQLQQIQFENIGSVDYKFGIEHPEPHEVPKLEEARQELRQQQEEVRQRQEIRQQERIREQQEQLFQKEQIRQQELLQVQPQPLEQTQHREQQEVQYMPGQISIPRALEGEKRGYIQPLANYPHFIEIIHELPPELSEQETFREQLLFRPA